MDPSGSHQGQDVMKRAILFAIGFFMVIMPVSAVLYALRLALDNQ